MHTLEIICPMCGRDHAGGCCDHCGEPTPPRCCLLCGSPAVGKQTLPLASRDCAECRGEGGVVYPGRHAATVAARCRCFSAIAVCRHCAESLSLPTASSGFRRLRQWGGLSLLCLVSLAVISVFRNPAPFAPLLGVCLVFIPCVFTESLRLERRASRSTQDGGPDSPRLALLYWLRRQRRALLDESARAEATVQRLNLVTNSVRPPECGR